LPEAEALSVQLEELGIRPADVDTVLLTHLHADHTGNVGLFTEARFVTGERNWPSHVGSVLNADIHPTLISDGEIGAIEPLSERTAVVLLPGHTHGHLGLQLSVGGTTHVFVGDATFDPSQTHRGAISGVSEDGARARATQRYLRNQTHLWPAHDPSVFERLPVSVGP
ncbi:MAG: MBL fold metallo-hydrolase, partial [Myxococcota bacterium]